MASDDDFFVVRKFGNLGARCLLQMQDHLCQLKNKLDALDENAKRGARDSSALRDTTDERFHVVKDLIRDLHTYSRLRLLMICYRPHLNLQCLPK